MYDINNVRPGEIRYVDFGEETECLQGGVRPALITQNEIGCRYSPIIRVIPLTSQISKCKSKKLPMHVAISKTKQNGLRCDSVVLVEQERPIQKKNIGEFIGIMEKEVVYKCGVAFKNNSSIFPPDTADLLNRYAIAY